MRRQSEIMVPLVWLLFGAGPYTACDVPPSQSASGNALTSEGSGLAGRSKLAVDTDALAPQRAPLAGALCRARGVFHDLGELPGRLVAGGATSVSADGDVVVGCSHTDSGNLAYRWTPRTGARALAAQDSACALAVSPDGKLIAGAMTDPSWLNGQAAVLWQNDSPPEHLYAPVVPGGLTQAWFNVAYAVTDSGAVFGYGVQQNAYGDWIGLRAQNGTLSPLGTSVVYAVGGDGAFFVGADLPGKDFPLYYATLNQTNLGYPKEMTCVTPARGECTSTAFGVSADGSVVVGQASGPPPGQNTGWITLAFAWTAADGMHWLPDLRGGIGAAVAFAANGRATADGTSVIVGYATDSARRWAAVWMPGPEGSTRVHTLEGLLAAEGIHVPPGFRLETATAVSADGRVIVGQGTRPDGRKSGWRAVLARFR